MKKALNVISFVVMVALGRLWIEFDQDLLPHAWLMPAFILIVMLLLTGYFFIVKPANAMRLALILSFVLVPIVVALSLVQHIAIGHDFAEVWKHSLIIWALAFGLPYFAGVIFSIIKKTVPARRP
jgi:hypothetical protein